MSDILEEQAVVMIPALALRGLTIFPNMLLHFDVGRPSSIQALDEAMKLGQSVFLVAQRDFSVEEPTAEDLFQVGTLSHVRQMLRLPGENVRVMVEGTTRARILEVHQCKPYISATIETIVADKEVYQAPRTEALIRNTYELFEHYIELAPRMTADILLNVLASDDPGYIADYIAQNLPMRVGEKQAILEELHPVHRLELLCNMLFREVEILETELDMQDKVQERMASGQREYYLREQMKVIQRELGDGGYGGDSELAEYYEKIMKLSCSEAVQEKLLKELSRLEKQSFGSAEATVLRNYLDVCLELPWQFKTKDTIDVNLAGLTLNHDHFGLDKVKERILEFIAVRQLAPDIKGQIICLVGPPGVGKTSIASSVAKAMGRNMARISLGGVHDEAEIRGHRKTYVGAMPGRIITAIKQAGSSNPLLLLDEIDKLGSDHRGDPASALLEVLDGEQNATFRDHFIEMPFDLSDVFFITTANTVNSIPRPLLDRMEIIELTSYTDEEKLQIAKKYLLPKERKRHGLKSVQLQVSDKAIRTIIADYTRESGVRLLERKLASMCRKVAMAIVSDDVKSIRITDKNLETYLGIPVYHKEHHEKTPQVGVVNGLAWTSVGGTILSVEVNAVPGTGKIVLTGNLGTVMKESAQAALTYIRSRSNVLGLPEDFYSKKDLHVHFPEGAVPKDGPSAGIAITTAMVSALTDIPVCADLAMTGEITLRGRVLPIGGLKEKSMAALRNGVSRVLIPVDNVKDLEEIDQTVREHLTFIPVCNGEEVLTHALTHMPQSISVAQTSKITKGSAIAPQSISMTS